MSDARRPAQLHFRDIVHKVMHKTEEDSVAHQVGFYSNISGTPAAESSVRSSGHTLAMIPMGRAQMMFPLKNKPQQG